MDSKHKILVACIWRDLSMPLRLLGVIVEVCFARKSNNRCRWNHTGNFWGDTPLPLQHVFLKKPLWICLLLTKESRRITVVWAHTTYEAWKQLHGMGWEQCDVLICSMQRVSLKSLTKSAITAALNLSRGLIDWVLFLLDQLVMITFPSALGPSEPDSVISKWSG